MNKKEVVVCIVLVIAFFILANSFNITGFTIIEAGVDIDQEVLDEINENQEVDVIVKLKEDREYFFLKQKVDVEDVLEDLNENEFKQKHEFEKGFSGKVTSSGLNKLKADLDVERIELNHPMGIFLQDSINIVNATVLHSFGILGSDKSVCVVDTGIAYDHPDLAGKYLGGFDFFNNDSEPYDDHGHGTHVSGIIAANGDVVGIAKEANIVMVKVVDANGIGSEADIIKGIEYCTEHKDDFNITVISMSLGTSTTFETYCDDSFVSLAEAINNAVANDIIVIAASGNAGSTTGISSPACIYNATSVGATTKSDGIASYSNRNSLTDLLATGSSITSLWLTGTKTLSGTSMSAPHVSASIALFKSYNEALTNEEIINALKDGKIISGISRIDLYKAYLSLDKEIPVINFIEPEDNITINYTGVLFNITSNEILDNVIIEIDYINETMFGSNTNFYFAKTLNHGNHNYKVYGADLAGNIGVSEERSLFVDVLLENITYYPENTNVEINEPWNQTFSAVGENLTIIWYLDEVNVSIGEDYTFIGNYDSSGIHNVTVYANSNYNYWNLIINNTNRAPSLNESISDQEWNENTNLELDLIYFLDPDSDELIYSASDVENISTSFNGGIVSLIPDGNFTGVKNILFYASDGEYNVESNNVNLTVKNVIICGDSIIEGSEECDSGNLDDKSCSDFDYEAGNLSCSSCIFNLDQCYDNPPPEEEEETPPDEGSGGSGGGGGGGSGGGTPIEEESVQQETVIEPAAPSESLEELFETTSEETEEVKEEVEQEKITAMTAKEGIRGKFSWILLSIVTLVVIVGIVLFRKFYKK